MPAFARPVAVVAVAALMAFAACKGTERQAVRKTAIPATPAASRPLDLFSDTVDANGFLVNPRWAVQDTAKLLPNVDSLCGGFKAREVKSADFLNNCTNYRKEIVFVPAKLKVGKLCAGEVGHVNWRVSRRPPVQSATTVSGRVFAADEALFRFLGGVGNVDGDIDMMLQTPGNPGRTRHNPQVSGNPPPAGSVLLELEFRLAEVRERWTSDFWTVLADDVGVNSGKIHRMLDGRLAVAVGVFGVDGVHDSHSEIHPVMALAVRTNVAGKTETWEVFVRNWGDEGMCGQEDQPLELPHDTLYLRLPWRPGATSAQVRFDGARSLRPATFAKDSIAFAFPLGRASTLPLIDGTLHVTWSVAAARTDSLAVHRIHWKEQAVTAEERAGRGLSRAQGTRLQRIVFPTAGQARQFQSRWAEHPGELDSVWISAVCSMKSDSLPEAGRCPPGLHP